MNVAVVTTADDQFGGVFARAYREAGGPPPRLIVVLPGRTELGFRGVWKLVAAWKLLGIAGALRIIAARKLGVGVARVDRESGLRDRWLAALRGPETTIVERDRINDAETVALIRSIGPDVLVSLGSPVILKAPVLEVARTNLNVHNGLLPSYRGHFGTFWEVYNREPVAYSTIHEMTTTVDAGRVVAAEATPLSEVDSFVDLMIAKKRAGGRGLARVLLAFQRDGRLPEMPAQLNRPSGYHGWPSNRELLAFSWRRARRAAAKGSG